MTDKASILIVDDRPEKLLALEAVLEDLGEHIVRAYSGREALRHVLEREFAVILLDVNMPGMDGFETASLIRQRKSSEHVPIIFVTAFSDEIHATRGYQLGAVDYILAPVIPEVLRTKVAVFVDLFKKTEQVKRQAESLRRRAGQLQKLAAASVAINGALSIDRLLQTVTDTARDVIGSHQAITMFLLGPGAGQQKPPKTMAVCSFSQKYADWRDRRLKLDAIATTIVAQSRTATRMSAAELRDHPDWEIVSRAEIPPVVGGMLAAPLASRDGTGYGVIYLSDRFEGEFTSDDEAVLVQLTQMASIAIENSLFADEREANRLKDEFLATLSHELRTPLNAILGWTQLLRMQGVEGEVSHGLEVIERNAKVQTKLIEDLLDVSRITTGKMRLNTRPVRVAAVVRAAVDAVRPALEAKQIRAEVAADGADGATVHGDADRLQQVFWNLLSNAVKFTPPGGRITARLDYAPTPAGAASADANGAGGEGNPGLVRLRVTDSGAGIEPKFLPHVFDRFRQADSSSTRQHGGLGIGLTIVRHIVELHGGSVRADSDGEGRGATFTVTLPRAADAPAQPAEGGPATPAVRVAAGGGPAPCAAGPGHDLTGLRVLVVDDEPDAREVMAEILRRCGATVAAAEGTADALDLFRRDRPDVLVSDIAMPGDDGYALIRRVRGLTMAEGGATPAIALTAYARDEDRRRALDAGFHNHLIKPVEPADLVAAVAEAASDARGAKSHDNGNARPREAEPDVLKLKTG